VVDALGLPGDRSAGISFQRSDGQAHLVSAEALQQTFGAAGSSVQLVVLNACYSDEQSAALVAYVNCVVGMSGSIPDNAIGPRSDGIGSD
jgi:hypothetical protein